MFCLFLCGNTTKLSKYLVEHKKNYIATLELGKKSDTGDIEGNIVEEKEVPKNALEEKYIRDILNSFLGVQTQIPPIYSAIKVNGKKLYEYAREGKKVEIPKRQIEIYYIKLLDIKITEITFEVQCSKGTYIRTLCEDIAKKLGTVGYMKKLQRTMVDKFSIEKAITFEELEDNQGNIKWLEDNSYTMEEILKDLPKIELEERKKELFLNGVRLTKKENDGLYNIYCNQMYLGTGIIEKNLLKRDIILQN